MSTFTRANILLPKINSAEAMAKWSVIACDQYTSEPEYWNQAKEIVGEEPSTLKLILPEAYMDEVDTQEAIKKINDTMNLYQEEGIFTEYKDSYIYIERTLLDGSIRRGIVGAVDLEQYDYSDDAATDIRATEKTVPERIPPRMNIRRGASLELPHVLLLCNDDRHLVLESVADKKNGLKLVYDFDLMQNGGHIRGWLVDGEAADTLDEKLKEYGQYCREKYASTKKAPLLYAMGDGNHSLATAKACYEELKKNNPGQDLSNHPARYALLEMGNIQDQSQQIEPIHRVVTETDVNKLIGALKNEVCAKEGYPLTIHTCHGEEEVFLDKDKGELAIAVLQKFLDEYLNNERGKIDYIHGVESVKTLAHKENAVGFILPEFDKDGLFAGIVKGGVLPRKTFSMGHADEKRFYLEARRIK